MMRTPDLPTKPRKDSQLSNLAGEFFVAAELLKRDLQTSVTFGNAKAVDLLAHNPRTSRHFSIQVKAKRTHGYFPISVKSVERGCTYVFVRLGHVGQAVRYFIVHGSRLLDDSDRFGKDFRHRSIPGIRLRYLQDFENKWSIFEEVSPEGKKKLGKESDTVPFDLPRKRGRSWKSQL
jgi:hypothetical protein